MNEMADAKIPASLSDYNEPGCPLPKNLQKDLTRISYLAIYPA
jgi:hypothetical protein